MEKVQTVCMFICHTSSSESYNDDDGGGDNTDLTVGMLCVAQQMVLAGD